MCGVRTMERTKREGEECLQGRVDELAWGPKLLQTHFKMEVE